MPDWIRTRSCTVSDLFSDSYRFLLPYFQRGYAWQITHAERLFDDILDVSEGRRKLPWYPLGSIIIAKTDDSPDAWLTDGHQRLVTLTILISLLRDAEIDVALKEELQKCIFSNAGSGMSAARLQTQEKARRCLADYVQAIGQTAVGFDGDVEELGDSESNIIINRDRLRDRIAVLSRVVRQRFARFLLDSCVVVVMEVASEEIARILFSTMHDTGLKPSSVDLFKAEVLGAINPEERDTARVTWEALEASLGRVNIDLLLTQITILAERKLPKEPVEGRLNAIFNLDQSDQALKFVETRFSPVGTHLIAVLAAKLASNDRPNAVERYLRFLSWVRNHDTWLSPALHWLDRYGPGDRHTLEFMKRLEALAWTQMIIAGDPAARDKRYMDLLGDISEGIALTPASCLMVSDKERLDVRRILSGPNFTKRRYKQFLLLRIDAEIGHGAEALAPPLGTIEHIYPGRPHDSSQWKIDFKGPKASILRQTIGNLTLLTTDEQNTVKNLDFVHKREVYGKSRFALTRSLATLPAWTPADVTARTDRLIETAMGGWGLS